MTGQAAPDRAHPRPSRSWAGSPAEVDAIGVLERLLVELEDEIDLVGPA